MVLTDEASTYNRLKVKHSAKEFVNGMVHTNGMKSV